MGFERKLNKYVLKSHFKDDFIYRIQFLLYVLFTICLKLDMNSQNMCDKRILTVKKIVMSIPTVYEY